MAVTASKLTSCSYDIGMHSNPSGGFTLSAGLPCTTRQSFAESPACPSLRYVLGVHVVWVNIAMVD